MVPEPPYYLHLGLPSSRYHPMLPDWIKVVWEGVIAQQPDWNLRCFEYDNNCGFVVQDQITAIKGTPGPVLLVEPVQTTCRNKLLERISLQFSVMVEDVSCEDELTSAVNQSIDAYI